MNENIKAIEISDGIQKGRDEFLDENAAEVPIFDQKIELATEGQEPAYRDHLKTKILRKNFNFITDFVTKFLYVTFGSSPACKIKMHF